jgi:hypothetical protein
MRGQHGYLVVLLCLTVCGCPGSDVAFKPKITAGQIEKDAEAGLPSSTTDGAYEEGDIEILESNYSGDKATIVLTAGRIKVGRLVPADIENLKPEIRAKAASIDTIAYKLRLDYQWVRGEWRLRQLYDLTFEKQ